MGAPLPASGTDLDGWKSRRVRAAWRRGRMIRLLRWLPSRNETSGTWVSRAQVRRASGTAMPVPLGEMAARYGLHALRRSTPPPDPAPGLGSDLIPCSGAEAALRSGVGVLDDFISAQLAVLDVAIWRAERFTYGRPVSGSSGAPEPCCHPAPYCRRRTPRLSFLPHPAWQTSQAKGQQ